jgi:predicted nucleic acid-binding protein
VYLAALGDFELLRHLFGKIAIPQAVFEEVAVGGARLPVAHSVLLRSSIDAIYQTP